MQQSFFPPGKAPTFKLNTFEHFFRGDRPQGLATSLLS